MRRKYFVNYSILSRVTDIFVLMISHNQKAKLISQMVKFFQYLSQLTLRKGKLINRFIHFLFYKNRESKVYFLRCCFVTIVGSTSSFTNYQASIYYAMQCCISWITVVAFYIIIIIAITIFMIKLVVVVS